MYLKSVLCALTALASPFAHAHSLVGADAGDRLPALLTGVLLLTVWAAYVLGSRRVAPRLANAWLFHGTALLALLTLLGPFDTWAETGSAMHMVQHMLMMIVIAPLWVLSRPLPQLRAALGTRFRGWYVWPLKAASRPGAMAAAHGAVIWFWHAPRPYMLAVEHPWWHAVEHACFLITAGLFWWSVLRAGPANRGRAMLALLVTLMHTGLLGALLTFSRTPVYYEANDLADQQLAGLIMWVPGGTAYIAASAWCAHRWLRQALRRSSAT